MSARLRERERRLPREVSALVAVLYAEMGRAPATTFAEVTTRLSAALDRFHDGRGTVAELVAVISTERARVARVARGSAGAPP